MSRAATRRVLTLALAMFCLVGAGAQFPPPGYDRPRDGPYPDTLEFLLRALDLDYTRLPGGMPTLKFWNYDYENNADLFAIAFYYRDPNDSNRMLDTLEVIVLDKATGTWKRRAFDAEHMAGLFKTADPGPGPGSVMNVWHTRRYLLIDTHLTPSAGTIIVLTRALEPTAMLYGWTLFTLANESIVYHASNMHFAPTHDLNVRMYDPRSGKTRTIYPTKPYDPPRREFIELTRKAYARYGDDWFRQHNHHKDAEQFNSRWGQLWIVDERTNAMAFSGDVRVGTRPRYARLTRHGRTAAGNSRCVPEHSGDRPRHVPGNAVHDTPLRASRSDGPGASGNRRPQVTTGTGRQPLFDRNPRPVPAFEPAVVDRLRGGQRRGAEGQGRQGCHSQDAVDSGRPAVRATVLA